MTFIGVIDSSIGFSWVHPAQACESCETLLQRLEQGERGVVPPLWFVEMANGLLVLQRRGKISSAKRREALEALSGLGLEVDDSPAVTAFRSASDLAEKSGLTVYDAIYLDTAMRLRIPLATRDSALKAAARRHGVTLL